jgi:hypothetical protein
MKHEVLNTPHLSKCPHCKKAIKYLLMEDMHIMDGKDLPGEPKKHIGGCIEVGRVLICPKCHVILKAEFSQTQED